MPKGRRPLPPERLANPGDHPGRRGAGATAPGGLPPMPYTLSPDSRQWWDILVAVLLEQNTLTTVDGVAIGQAAEALAEVVRHRTTLSEEGEYIDASTLARRVITKHPAHQLLEAADRRAHRWLESLGLTPASRSRVRPAAVTGPNPFDDLDG